MARVRRLSRSALLVAVLAAVAAPASSADLGIRGGLYTEIDEPFVGIELLSHVGGALYFNPNVEYVFVDGATYGTGNFDAHIDLPTGGTPYVWVGAGLALVYANPDGPAKSDVDAHANLLAGIGFRTGGAVPYIQVKYITGDPHELVVAAGIRF
jgi:hypothetical protein